MSDHKDFWSESPPPAKMDPLKWVERQATDFLKFGESAAALLQNRKMPTPQTKLSPGILKAIAEGKARTAKQPEPGPSSAFVGKPYRHLGPLGLYYQEWRAARQPQPLPKPQQQKPLLTPAP